MIGSIRHKALRRFFETGDGKGIAADQLPRVKRLISALHAADRIEELSAVPGWRFHPLKGDLVGYYSLAVSGNWRLIFRWSSGVAEDLDLVDYH